MGRCTSVGILFLWVVCSTAYAASPFQAQILVLHQQEVVRELMSAQLQPEDAFWAWKAKYNKVYTDQKELEHRFQVWQENLKSIVEHNAKGASCTFCLNQMADLTAHEFKMKYTSGNRQVAHRPSPDKLPMSTFSMAVSKLPASVDWRKQHAVSEVKNQQQCGSCWAFSTTGAVEGIRAITNKQLASLSEQELVDCDTYVDNGCNGGNVDYAFAYVRDNGIHQEADYPYTGHQGYCLASQKWNLPSVKICGWSDVPRSNEDALKRAVYQQPVSVAIEADQSVFQHYCGGVLDDSCGSCGTTLDHAVLVVGYDTDEQGGYWIVKNSWGVHWGENGYIRMRMGVDQVKV